MDTIPKATGTYFAAARGLIEQPAFLRLNGPARHTLLTVERMLPACAAATLFETLIAVHTGIEDADVLRAALATLETSGWLFRVGDWYALPHLLDLVREKSARGRVIGETRELPDAVQDVLRARHPWVMGRRAKGDGYAQAGAGDARGRLCVTDAGARNPARNQPTNQPTGGTNSASGGWQSERPRALSPEPGGAPVARASTSPDGRRADAGPDAPEPEAEAGAEDAEDTSPPWGEGGFMEYVRGLGIKPSHELRREAWDRIGPLDPDPELDAIRRDVLARAEADRERETDE